MLTGLKKLIKKNIKYLKALFIFSILIFVVYEVGHIFKQIDWSKVQTGLAHQSLMTIGLLFLVGLVAVTPMITYDLVIVRFLPGKYSLPYIIKSGWIVNTATNVAGFGGVVGASLRANFYNKDASPKQILYALSKIALYVLAGLSIYCWIALFLIYGRNLGSEFGSYWLWLVGGGLYFPLLFIGSKLKKTAMFSDMTFKREMALILGSFMEWTFVGGYFLFVGLMLGVKTDFLTILAYYMTGAVLGMVSMVPGGLGSFDVFMLYGMATLGVSNEVGVVWLLFFRLFYYIIPFIIGMILFVHEAGAAVDRRFDGILRMVVQKVAHFLVTCFLYLSAILMLLFAAVPHFASANEVLLKLHSYTFFFFDQMNDIIFAMALMGLARGISAKVQRAFWPTVAVLGIGIVNTVYQTKSLSLAFFLGLVLLFVWLSRKELYRQQLQYSLGKMVADVVIFAGVFILYAIVGIINTPQFSSLHRIPKYLLFPAQRIWFSGFLGMVISALIVLVILLYLTHGANPLYPRAFDGARLQKMLASYSNQELGHLAFLRDKLLYFYQKDGVDQALIMYRRRQDKLFCLGDMIGNPTVFKEALEHFIKEADIYGFEPVFYDVSQNFANLLHDLGYDYLKLGYEALVDLEQGSSTEEQADLSSQLQATYRLQWQKPPYLDDLLADLESLADKEASGQEFFSKYYLDHSKLLVAFDQQGQAVAAMAVYPKNKSVLAYDLLGLKPDASQQLLSWMHLEVMLHGKNHGFKYLDLGLKGKAQAPDNRYQLLDERLAAFIYNSGTKNDAKKLPGTLKADRYLAYRKRTSVAVTSCLYLALSNEK